VGGGGVVAAGGVSWFGFAGQDPAKNRRVRYLAGVYAKMLQNVDLDLDLDFPEIGNRSKWSVVLGHAFRGAAQAEHTAWTGLTRGSGGPPTSSLGTRAKQARSGSVCKTVWQLRARKEVKL